MPQGGVEYGEDFLTAMKRELHEETNITSIKIIKEIKKYTNMSCPKILLVLYGKGKFRGQRQKWFIVKFIGNENEINLNTKQPEFIEWKWINIEMLPNVIVDFKKDLYLNLLKEIKMVIG
jgi:putative (di)nucleoside polyphosphate hydrolase